MDLPDTARRRDLRIAIRVITPCIMAAFVAGAAYQYRRATAAVEERFNEKQFQLARQAADRLSEMFREVRVGLEMIARLGPLTRTQPMGHLFLSEVAGALEEHGAVAVWRSDGEGRVRVASGREGPALARLSRKQGSCLPHAGMSICGPLPSDLVRSGWVLVASVPVRNEPAMRAALEGPGAPAALQSPGTIPSEPETGIVSVALDWGEVQELVARLTRWGTETYSWVLDHEGRLVLHPTHREQLGQDALRRGEVCARCHASFDVHRRMAEGGTGTGRIQVVNGEPKLVAFTPFQVGGGRWSLAVATPASTVTAEERRSLTTILLFTGAMVLVLMVGAGLLDREATQRIRATAAFSKELERKVAERTSELQSLHGRLSGMQARHTRLERVAVAGEMAAVVAHEIRTPLNALSINAQMIIRKLRRGQEGDREKALEVLGTLEREIQRINTLLEEHVLSLVRHRPSSSRPLCLNEAVTEALRFMEPEGSRQKVQLLPDLADDLPRVEADEAKLRQVLLNILLNAIQAMPGGGKVFVTTEAGDGVASVRIRDTGPGIAGLSAEEVEQVFRPFMTTKEDGTGLGLAICARLVKEMKGKIRVFSKPGEGACFVVSLPVAEEEERCP